MMIRINTSAPPPMYMATPLSAKIAAMGTTFPLSRFGKQRALRRRDTGPDPTLGSVADRDTGPVGRAQIL
jgi:hypothetical protein